MTAVAPRILLVDDEANFRKTVVDLLKLEGYEVFTAPSGADALAILEDVTVDIVITDVRMPRMSGVELLQRLRHAHPDVDVIVLTGYGSIHDAVRTIKMGAYNYVMKPVNFEELARDVRDILRMRNRLPEGSIASDSAADSIVGSSPPIRHVRHLIDRFAASELPVLIEGESGTGKELVANAIHARSPRAENPFVRINCAALPEPLTESELFGYERGAFTGATQQKKGKIELASGGTLFLDEIAEMPLGTQAKLLRAIEQQEIERLGGTEVIKVDVRLIAATNQNLRELVQRGEFRKDLYYRINAVSIKTPPLRSMPEDIPRLANYFLDKHCAEVGKPVPRLGREVMQILLSHPWPGNVRELANVIRRAAILCDGGELNPGHLPAELAEPPAEVAEDDARTLSLDELERRHIARVLRLTAGNKNAAARLLNIHRDTLYRKIRKYNLLSDTGGTRQPE